MSPRDRITLLLARTKDMNTEGTLESKFTQTVTVREIQKMPGAKGRIQALIEELKS